MPTDTLDTGFMYRHSDMGDFLTRVNALLENHIATQTALKTIVEVNEDGDVPQAESTLSVSIRHPITHHRRGR